MDSELIEMKMENSAALNIFFKHIFSRIGKSKRVLKATWPAANVRDVFQSHGTTWYDTGKNLMKLTGLYYSRCCGWEAGMTDKRLCTCKPNRNWRFTVIHQWSVNAKVGKKKSHMSYFHPVVWDVLGNVFGIGQNSYKNVTIILLTSSQTLPHKKLKHVRRQKGRLSQTKGSCFADMEDTLLCFNQHYLMFTGNIM